MSAVSGSETTRASKESPAFARARRQLDLQPVDRLQLAARLVALADVQRGDYLVGAVAHLQVEASRYANGSAAEQLERVRVVGRPGELAGDLRDRGARDGDVVRLRRQPAGKVEGEAGRGQQLERVRLPVHDRLQVGDAAEGCLHVLQGLRGRVDGDLAERARAGGQVGHGDGQRAGLRGKREPGLFERGVGVEHAS